jgi:hypothetical protein
MEQEMTIAPNPCYRCQLPLTNDEQIDLSTREGSFTLCASCLLVIVDLRRSSVAGRIAA